MRYTELPIVFFGTPDFAVKALSTLLGAGCNVRAVVTAPDKPAGRGHKLLQSAVKQFALEHGRPVLQPTNLKSAEFIEELRALDASLFVVIAFRMLPEAVWAMPPLGTFNVHASLLPRYRGAAPINRAIMAGEETTGVTTFFLTHEIDTGSVIARLTTPIMDSDNAGSLHDRLADMGAVLALDTVKAIAAGKVTPVAQSEFEAEFPPCPAPKIFKEDCRIDWSRPAAEVINHIRGLAPYPAAWSPLADNGAEVKITGAKATGTPSTTPGAITTDGKHLWVDCGDSRVEITELQPAGKKRMPAADWLRGLREVPQAFSL